VLVVVLVPLALEVLAVDPGVRGEARCVGPALVATPVEPPEVRAVLLEGTVKPEVRVEVAPVVEELATEYAGKLKVMKLNTDENPETAGRYQIMSIPTILFFKDGKPVEKLIGARP
jgi:thiol-disulfide isomerase/thioredoxin